MLIILSEELKEQLGAYDESGKGESFDEEDEFEGLEDEDEEFESFDDDEDLDEEVCDEEEEDYDDGLDEETEGIVLLYPDYTYTIVVFPGSEAEMYL